MLHYLSKRALSSLMALFLFVSLMFFVTEIMIPGDFSTQFTEQLSSQQRAEIQHRLGLDIPLGQRYLNWLQDLLHGNLGMSLYGRPVLDVLKESPPYTLLVFFLGTIFYTIFPPWLAFLVARLASRRLSLTREFRSLSLDPFKCNGRGYRMARLAPAGARTVVFRRSVLLRLQGVA